MEYYIYNVPVFVMGQVDDDIDLPAFCQEVEEILPSTLLKNVEVVYVGQFPDLAGRNAAFSNGAIYMSLAEPTNFDMLENFIHETAHSLEESHGWDVFDESLRNEFLTKRRRLQEILEAGGYRFPKAYFDNVEYSKKFDEFLSEKVGYPTLVSLTIGLFVSPYGATSLQEYFANGFEKYFLDESQSVRRISPVLYRKIEEIINDET